MWATKKLAFISCVVLAVIVASAQQYNVPFRPRAAAGGGGNLLSETFDGATGGYDNTWTESGTGTIDQDETAACGTGTGWSGDCLELVYTASQTGKTTSAFAAGAQTGDVWVRLRAKVTYSVVPSNWFGIAGLSNTTATTAGGILLEFHGFGPGPEISLRRATGGGVSTELGFTAAPASGETHCYEFYANNNTDDWAFWIDGTCIDGSISTDGCPSSAVASGATIDPTNLWMLATDMDGVASATIYIDDVQVSNVSRQTCS